MGQEACQSALADNAGGDPWTRLIKTVSPSSDFVIIVTSSLLPTWTCRCFLPSDLLSLLFPYHILLFLPFHLHRRHRTGSRGRVVTASVCSHLVFPVLSLSLS